MCCTTITHTPLTSFRTDDVFICHSGRDAKHMAVTLEVFLRVLGLNAWLDRTDIRTTVENSVAIVEGIMRCRIFLAIVTDNYWNSDWPQRETAFALQHTRVLPAFAMPVAKCKTRGWYYKVSSNHRRVRDGCVSAEFPCVIRACHSARPSRTSPAPRTAATSFISTSRLRNGCDRSSANITQNASRSSPTGNTCRSRPCTKR